MLVDKEHHRALVFINGEYDHIEHCRCRIGENHETDRTSEAGKRAARNAWYARNKDRINAKRRTHAPRPRHATKEESIAALKAAKRAWYERNREKQSESAKQRYAAKKAYREATTQ